MFAQRCGKKFTLPTSLAINFVQLLHLITVMLIALIIDDFMLYGFVNGTGDGYYMSMR